MIVLRNNGEISMIKRVVLTSQSDGLFVKVKECFVEFYLIRLSILSARIQRLRLGSRARHRAESRRRRGIEPRENRA